MTDAAVVRRVRMLRAGGAEVKLLGFRRSAQACSTVDGVPAVDLGQTHDGKLGRRAALVLRRCLEAGQWRDWVAGCDVLLARNLEMCTIALAARKRVNATVPLVFECLDIHTALSGANLPSKLLLAWEKHILHRCAALVVSSPGFLTHHFRTLGVDLPRVILAENKRVMVDAAIERPPLARPANTHWRVGWFGNIRCADSFHMLLALARRGPDIIDVTLRGKPSRALQALIDRHLPLPNMVFHGPYQQAELATIYQAVHFTWGCDYYEAGLNSDWLLPNRLYEGSFFNRPVIAATGTQTAEWLQARGAGVLLDTPAKNLEPFLRRLTPDLYADLQRAAAAIPTTDLVWTRADCERFVAQLAGHKAATARNPIFHIADRAPRNRSQQAV
ncbi:hypothetical protein [Rhodopila sp.]|uniref:hypothetical protein n=1 Tax=Rhodopila sp. TaxID=2480087 RepID=UPI003D147D3B